MNATASNRWAKSDVHAFLSKGRWFGSLPSSIQDAILAPSEVTRFQANSTIYKLGDAVDGLYAVLDGDIRSYVYDDDGQRAFFRPIGPGSWFGNVPLLSGAPWRTLEMRAASAATLLFLPEKLYCALTEANQEIYRAFVQLTCNHMNSLARVLIEQRSDAPLRAARALLRLARAHGVTTAEGTRLAMNLSQADLASLVGVSRQYVNELIARWEEEGLLRWNGKAQPMLDVGRLRGLLGSLDDWMDEYEGWV